MKPQEIWTTLGDSNKIQELPSQADLDRYNEIVYQRKLRSRKNAILREFHTKISKILKKVEREVGCYPSDSNSYFLDNLQDINAFESEKDLLHAILTSKDPKNKKVQAISQIIKNYNNPKLDFSPIILEDVVVPKQEILSTSNDENTNHTLKVKTDNSNVETIKPLEYTLESRPELVADPTGAPLIPAANNMNTFEYADYLFTQILTERELPSHKKKIHLVTIKKINKIQKKNPNGFLELLDLCFLHYQRVYSIKKEDLRLYLKSPLTEFEGRFKIDYSTDPKFTATVSVVRNKHNLLLPARFSELSYLDDENQITEFSETFLNSN